MAEPKRRGDKYRHIIQVNGIRKTGTFDTKKDARAWEAGQRALAASTPGSPGELVKKKHTLSESCDKYLKSITPMKRGATDWETRRFNALIAQFPGRFIEDITSEDVAIWRDDMATKVSGSTINRYWNLYSNLFTVARKEWKWIKDNPFSEIKRPKENSPRTAVWRWSQIRRVLREGQRRGGKTGEVVKAFHVALHTSLRLQEALVAPAVYNEKTLTMTLPSSKVSAAPEVVPTMRRARRLITRHHGKPFAVGPNEASTLFCSLLRQMQITGLQFKDARATALTLMSRKMDVLTLAKFSRHRDLELLRSTYYRESLEDISRRT